MRHIKLFEDYTEEELKDLQDDLDEVGLVDKLEQGKDFGFDTNLKGENNAFNYLFLTQETLDLLIDRKILKKDGEDYYFTNPLEWGIKNIKSQPHFYNPEHIKNNSLYGLRFLDFSVNDIDRCHEEVIKKLGEIRR